MTTYEALRMAVACDPMDDAPRLMFADHLAEYPTDGDDVTWATWIQLSVGASRRSCRNDPVAKESRRFFRANGDAISRAVLRGSPCGMVPRGKVSLGYARGFPELIAIDWWVWVEVKDWFGRNCPVMWLYDSRNCSRMKLTWMRHHLVKFCHGRWSALSYGLDTLARRAYVRDRSPQQEPACNRLPPSPHRPYAG